MRTYYIAAGHYGAGTGAIGFVDEGAQAIRMAHAVVAELKVRGHNVVLIPDSLDFMPAIKWANARDGDDDVVVELHMNSAASTKARGVACVYQAADPKGLAIATRSEAFLDDYFPRWANGIYTNYEIAKMRGWSNLGWFANCRAKTHPLLFEVGFVSSILDVVFFQTKRKFHRVVEAICDGLAGP